ncbi:winged helix-turn-helix transcriptional regulator [Saccharomonospora piscinae]|nr:winged helix-turn-helix transcriptional regulator [Saccharomonospora piscinae]
MKPDRSNVDFSETACTAQPSGDDVTTSDPRRGVPDGSPDQLAAQLIRLVRLAHRAKAKITKAGPEGLESAAYAILFHLVEGGPQRASRLAETLHADISTISRQSSALVDHGLVERQADPEDRRASLLAATAEGLRVFEENRRHRNRWIAGVLADWPEEDRRTLNVLLARLGDDIETRGPLGEDPPHRADRGESS